MAMGKALLRLLATRPRHGYELRQAFESATGGVWALNIGQVYTTLGRLERDGLVELADDDGERKTYAITPGGEEAVAAWLSTPAAPPGRDRDEVAMKLLVDIADAPEDALTTVDAQRAATSAEIQRLTQLKAATPDGELARLLQLDRAILRCRAELDWLDTVEERLARQGEQR